jgi:ATP-binding cassette subfamily B protein
LNKIDKKHYTLWGAAKFYIRVAFERPVDTIMPMIGIGAGTIFTLFVPSLFVSKILDEITNDAIPLKALITPILYIALSMLLGETLWRIGSYYLNKMETYQMQAITERTFRDFIYRPLSFHNNNFSGTLITRTSRLTRNFENFFDTIAFSVVDIATTLIFVGVILIPRAPLVYFSFYAIIGIYVVISLPIIKKRSKLNITRSRHESEETAALADAMTNAAAIKAFAHEKIEIERFHKATEKIRLSRRKTWDYQNLKVDTLTAPFYIMINVMSLLLAVIAHKQWGAPTSIVFLSFSYFSMLSRNIWGLNRLWRNIEGSLSEAAETLNMFAEPVHVKDIDNAEEASISQGDIVLNNITFQHDGNDDPLFSDVYLHIKPKEKIGLIGPSGSGKTTITKLILRFMDLDSGEIIIDGYDISKIKQHDLRRAIAYVPQEPILFHRSLKENIQFGKPSATEQDIAKASEQAHAHNFIDKLPNKYDTLVGERGVKLSGGQRQRIAIARAMIKDAPILILDEATSALDSASEKLIQDALWKLMEGRTAIVVAHRLSTVQRLDRIIVLDEGSVVEEGSHQELLDKKGLYAKLWSHQSGGFLKD